VMPFVTGGGGYLRQLYEDRLLIDTGGTLYAGGGLRVLIGSPRPASSIKVMGLRGETRAVWRSGGIEVGEESPLRPYVTVGAGFFLRF
jgi:hypothetical protein